MKLLILSDSHGRLDDMFSAAQKEAPDAIIHLGDHIEDARTLQRRLGELPFYMVRGNCDFQAAGDTRLFFPLEGQKIFITHGHEYGVKNGIHTLLEQGASLGADIVLYGHTHKHFVGSRHGMLVMNPGQLERNTPHTPASYGMIILENGQADGYIRSLPKLAY